MPVTSVLTDPEELTLVLVADFDVDADRAWQLWSDPRQLERWWGPPTFPATFVEHDFKPGGMVEYFMTGPEGETYPGWWRVLEIEPPRRLVLEDGFADETGAPVDGLPITGMTVIIDDAPTGGVTMTIRSQFPSREALEQMVAMGMVEGLTLAAGQIDAILAG